MMPTTTDTAIINTSDVTIDMQSAARTLTSLQITSNATLSNCANIHVSGGEIRNNCTLAMGGNTFYVDGGTFDVGDAKLTGTTASVFRMDGGTTTLQATLTVF